MQVGFDLTQVGFDLIQVGCDKKKDILKKRGKL